MKKKQGIMIYDSMQERMDIRLCLEEYYGGLHCGECFDVLIDKDWKPTRIEYGEDWYLIGISKNISLNGLQVRI